jgi:acyl-CoA dehydrogenase
MADTSYLDWPFLEAQHKELALSLERWAQANIHDAPHARGRETDAACVNLVRTLGAANWIRYAVGGQDWGGSAETIDTRARSA